MATTNNKKTKTELEIDEDTIAHVRENHRPGAEPTKVVTYDAKLKEKPIINEDDPDESGDNGEGSDIDFGLPFIDEPATQTVPQTGLDKMFANVRSAVLDDQCPDAFFAQVTRLADFMGANYNVPCNVPQMDIGSFQFTSRDRLPFTAQLQKLNGNSGGTFNIRIYRQDGTPLNLYRRSSNTLAPVQVEVSVTSMSVPNPLFDPSSVVETGIPQNNQTERMILQVMENSNQRFEKLVELMQQSKAPSELEQAMTRKMINDMVNPAPPPDPFAGIAGMMFAAQRFQDRLTDVILPPRVENAPVPEPDWMDKGEKLLNSPGAVAILERLGDITERITVAKLAPNAAPVEYETGNDDDNMELITKVIDELNSDSILNGDNETIVELATSYPSEFEDLRLACMSPFEIVLKQLTRTLGKKKPEVLQPFLDVAATQTKGLYVFNPSGDHLVNRLREFHAFINSLNETPVE